MGQQSWQISHQLSAVSCQPSALSAKGKGRKQHNKGVHYHRGQFDFMAILRKG